MVDTEKCCESPCYLGFIRTLGINYAATDKDHIDVVKLPLLQQKLKPSGPRPWKLPPIVPVLRFLSLFGGRDQAQGAQLVRLNPKGRKVDALSGREKQLLLSLREFLFEQRSKMKR